MSISLYLYSKESPTKTSIEQIIYPLGFKPVDESSGKLNYYWFKEENYESVRGVHLDILKAEQKDREIPRGTRTIFMATTYAGRCYEDIEMQNNVIRKLRSVFGGSVYNDDDGRYAYVTNYAPRLSPAEKRCGFVYSRFNNNIIKAKMAASDLDPHYFARKQFDEDLASLDRGLVTNNLVAVFLVSIFETFLKDLFISYIETHPNLQEKIFDRTSKLDFQTLKVLLAREKSIVEVEADYYNFQNIPSANAAYSAFLQINLFQLWRRKKKIGGKFYRIIELIEELIELRHNIIHKAYLKPEFDKAEVNKYLKAVESSSELITDALEKKGFRIDLEKHL